MYDWELLGTPRNSKLFQAMQIMLNPRPWNFWEYFGIVKSMTGNYWEFLGTPIISQTVLKNVFGISRNFWE